MKAWKKLLSFAYVLEKKEHSCESISGKMWKGKEPRLWAGQKWRELKLTTFFLSVLRYLNISHYVNCSLPGFLTISLKKHFGETYTVSRFKKKKKEIN